MKIKTSGRAWADSSTLTLARFYSDRHSSSSLGSNSASYSGSGASQVSIIWTDDCNSGQASPYCVEFLSFPINVVWSPFSTPTDPWDGNGIAPFGQYFSNLGEQVSTSTGMLTVRQEDLSIPGRGLDLDITRVYVEPNVFLNGLPTNYENYPWAPVGNGWRLNYPWFNNVTAPLYLHLWNGEAYIIPSNFWNGYTASWENHQGENFRLVRYVNGTAILSTKDGTTYNFDGTLRYRLTSITDTTGNNSIRFSYYLGDKISSITDTIGRAFLFCYTGGLLTSIVQTPNYTCGQTTRRITYTYSGSALTNVTDPAGRVTNYQYNRVDPPGVNVNRTLIL